VFEVENLLTVRLSFGQATARRRNHDYVSPRSDGNESVPIINSELVSGVVMVVVSFRVCSKVLRLS